MFGIIYAITCTGVAIIDGIRGRIEDYQLRENAKHHHNNRTSNIYLDRYGTPRDIISKEYRNIDFAIVEAKGKDQCIKDVHGNVVRNLTEEKRQERKRQAISNSRTVYLFNKYGNSRSNRRMGGDGYCEGTQFKDIQTGEIYVARQLIVNHTSMYFYMNMDGLLVRESDSCVTKRNKGEFLYDDKMIQNFIKEFNRNQYTNKPKVPTDSFGNPNPNDALYFCELGEYYRNKDKVLVDI